jgi:hypothetical protein
MKKTSQAGELASLLEENARLRAELNQAREQADRAYMLADEAMKSAEDAQKKALEYLAQMKAGTFYTTPAGRPQGRPYPMNREPQPNTRRAWMPRRRRF